MTGPLEGLRVIDCSRGTAGPRATGVLADYGADVVWIEPPGGDPCRDRLAAEYSVFNRGKRSVVLDLRIRPARRSCSSCSPPRTCSSRAGVPASPTGSGSTTGWPHEHSPGLVYCEITGFGLDGPHRDLAGHESLVHAVIGTMAEQVGHRDGPIFEGLPFAAIGASWLALIGVLAALVPP